jgi:hypothetical protein
VLIGIICNRLTVDCDLAVVLGVSAEQRKNKNRARGRALTRTMLLSLCRLESSEDVVVAIWATRCNRTRYMRSIVLLYFDILLFISSQL